MTDTLTQVRLRATVGGGQLESWIPTKSAFLGARMTVEDEEGLFEVISVGSTVEAAYIKERSRDYRNTRKASDI